MRWVAYGLAGLGGLGLAVCVAGWFLLDRFDLGPFAASRASAALGRPVSFGAVHVTPGPWLLVKVEDARVENAPGGSRPELARVAAATAEVETWPLLHGTLVIRNAVVDGLDVLLERTPAGPNWRTRPRTHPPDSRPQRDGSFPTLLDARVSGKVVVKTSSGTELPIGMDGLVFTAPALDQPSHLAGPASYKGVPIKLDAVLGSIAQYRQADEAFPATIDMVSGTTHLRFEGTMAAPLDLDGAQGTLLLEAPTPEVLYRVSGIDSTLRPAIKLAGGLEHTDPVWQLSQVQGALGPASIYGGTIRLEEGVRPNDTAPRPPDRVGLALQFEQLNLDALLSHGGKGSGSADMSLQVEQQPQTLLAAKLLAREMTYGGVRFTGVELDASQTSGEVAVQDLSLTYLGGKVQARGKVDATPEGGRVTADVQVTGMEVQALKGVLELGRLPLAGRLDGRAAVAATGETLNGALRTARSSVVVTMAGGSVSRQVVELGSTDVRALFRRPEGMVPISCVLGVMDVRSGVGTISPIRLRSAQGTVAGHGTVDLVRHQVDLTIASEARTTSIFALDVPVRVSGPFSNVSIEPAQLSATGRAQAASGDQIGRLLPALQGMARASPCLGR